MIFAYLEFIRGKSINLPSIPSVSISRKYRISRELCIPSFQSQLNNGFVKVIWCYYQSFEWKIVGRVNPVRLLTSFRQTWPSTIVYTALLSLRRQWNGYGLCFYLFGAQELDACCNRKSASVEDLLLCVGNLKQTRMFTSTFSKLVINRTNRRKACSKSSVIKAKWSKLQLISLN